MVNFLKRLELQGFKSFAGKTVLEFPSKVTAIVGPNGSGKSNVIDGLRWVLGERGAKELRGSTLENMIFAGTPKRAAVGFAKVSIYFDNRAKKMPFDAAEVSLVRKVDRSGASQTFLNDSEIKLRDLAPLLAKAKLGSHGLTMIGQGQSDLFVKSDPKERRMMIEEILGLREFRLKKEQSERRLALSRINMDKVKAMLDELSPHLKFLRKQKNRFDKRAEIEITLRELENKYFVFHYREIEAGIKNSEEPVFKISQKIKEKEEEIRILEKTIKEIDKHAVDSENSKILRDKIQKLFDEKSRLEKEIARMETRRELGQASAPVFSQTEVSDFFEKLKKEVEEALDFDDLKAVKIRLGDWLKRLNRFTEKEVSVVPNLSDGDKKIKKELEEIEKEIKILRAKEEESFSEQQKINREFRGKVEILERTKNEIRDLEQKRQAQTLEKEKFKLKLEELERRWISSGLIFHDLKVLAGDKDFKIEASDWNEIERKIMRLRGELAAIGEIDHSLVKEAEESEERHAFLSRELEDLEKATVDLKNLIKELDEKIHNDFKDAFRSINEEFNKYFRLMFGGGKAKLKIKNQISKIKNVEDENNETNNEPTALIQGEEDKEAGVEIDLTLPNKKLASLDVLSGGEKSLVSLAALFALISVSPPPFLVLDEIDAALDEENARRFSELVKEFSKQTQFIIVTHNRATMEAADILYGITLGEDGVSRVLSLKLE